MTSKEALDKLVNKTGIINDTCAILKDCIKSNKCKFEESVKTCDDYQLVMSIKQDLEWKTWCVDIWGYKSISELETRLESYSLTLSLINQFVEYIQKEILRSKLKLDRETKVHTMFVISVLNDILNKLKELGLYKGEE